MRQVNLVTGPAIAALGVALLALAPSVGQRACLVGSLTSGVCGTGGGLTTALAATLGVSFLAVGYACFGRGLTGY